MRAGQCLYRGVDNKREPAEYAELDRTQRAALLSELQAIMAVYAEKGP